MSEEKEKQSETQDKEAVAALSRIFETSDIDPRLEMEMRGAGEDKSDADNGEASDSE